MGEFVKLLIVIQRLTRKYVNSHVLSIPKYWSMRFRRTAWLNQFTEKKLRAYVCRTGQVNWREPVRKKQLSLPQYPRVLLHMFLFASTLSVFVSHFLRRGMEQTTYPFHLACPIYGFPIKPSIQIVESWNTCWLSPRSGMAGKYLGRGHGVLIELRRRSAVRHDREPNISPSGPTSVSAKISAYFSP